MHTASPRYSLYLFSFFIISLLAACDSNAPVDTNKEPKARPAKLFLVGDNQQTDFLSFPAVVQSQKLSALSFGVAGTVDEVFVVEAQKVKKGAVLATLDKRDLLAQLSSARAQFKNADTEYQRALRLIKEDAISRSKLEERKSKRDVTKSQLDTAEKALQDAVLIAPYTGAIAKVSIEQRQLVKSGEAAISLLGKGGLEAKINLPSSIVTKARKPKQPSNSYLVLEAAPSQRIPTVFKEASLEADAASQTIEVTFTFDAPDNLVILPGMNAVAWINNPKKNQSEGTLVSIPLTAIAIDGDKKYVWLVDADTQFVSKRIITIDEGVGVNLNVLTGLKTGDTIVAAGTSYLSEGVKVRPWSD